MSLSVAMSLLVSSGTAKEWFLWLECWEGRPSSPAPTPGSWQNSESILDEFSLTRIQQESCFRQWRLHTSLKTWETITELGWTVLPHPTHRPIKHSQISTCVESWRIHSIVWSFGANDCDWFNENLAMWARQGMVQRGDGHAFSSLS